jgi:hypothetical protein
MSEQKRKPWFGPHRIGYGWGPVAWQGWLVTLAIVPAAIILPLALFRHHHLF